MNSPKDYLTDRVKEEMQTIKKGVRVDLDNIIENLEGYNEADNKMPYEDVLFTQINSYFQAVLTKVEAFLTETITQSMEVGREKITGETSDGYHTFNELYEFRKVYNAVLFNEWAEQGKYNVHKSWKHSDGEKCFGGGWFIVSATLPTGQISNHYEAKDWDLFRCEERELADKWDGHTAQDVVTRLKSLSPKL